MKKKLLPLGKQNFNRLITDNCVYVDKTEHIYRLVTEGWYYFLSRPRRFGKSLLISTLKELFVGSRELFTGLWIENKWDWSKTNPVIHISFAAADYQGLGLEKAINYELDRCAKEYQIQLIESTNKGKFSELLKVLYEKHGKTVILIDEYDKPIIDFLETNNLPKAFENQTILKSFYSILKDSEPYLHFVFITGVSKFSKVSIFSDLNHLIDLTFRKDFATLLGYTLEELKNNFSDYLNTAAESFEMTTDELIDALRIQYDGYSWDGKNFVYNPFGTLNFLSAHDFHNFWFSSGTPTFLTRLMQQQVKFEYENIETNTAHLEKYSLDNLDIIALLFQTGYLTIKKRNFRTGDIVLDYPNQEIRASMYGFILDYLKHRQSTASAQEIVKDLAAAFHANNLNRVKDLLESMFGDLPENLYETDARRSERFYHSFIHLTFKFLGIYIKSEAATAKGYADSVVETPTHIYIFEFKHQESAEAAMTQLLEKNYAQKYAATEKTIVGIGVNFDKKQRIIEGWEVCTLKTPNQPTN